MKIASSATSLLLLILLPNPFHPAVSAAETPELPSLRRAYAPDFKLGVGLNHRVPDDYTAKERRLILGQFATITPANSMKMTHLQREEGKFAFEMGDGLVKYAHENRIDVCGHCLLWAKDEETPKWFFRDGDKPAGPDLLRSRLKDHIRAVAGHYRGRVISWDVVNEAIDDSKDGLRPSQWLSILGDDFLADAFRDAHEADPDATLIYNDYNIEKPAKRAKLLRLVRGLLDKKVPIHAVGIQGHWEIDQVPYDDIETTIKALHDLGLKVMVTELDLDVIPRSKWWADGGKHQAELRKLNPYKTACPPEILGRQAEQYARLFGLFRKHADAIERVTFWDLHDGRSWLNDFPWKRVDHPLLFDASADPKPAFWKVVGAERPAK